VQSRTLRRWDDCACIKSGISHRAFLCPDSWEGVLGVVVLVGSCGCPVLGCCVGHSVCSFHGRHAQIGARFLTPFKNVSLQNDKQHLLTRHIRCCTSRSIDTKGTPTSFVWHDRHSWGPPPPLPPAISHFHVHMVRASLPERLSSRMSPLQHNNNCLLV
jgi:hypothetical protein